MKYNPQKTEGEPYQMKRYGRPTVNLATKENYKLTDGVYDGMRHPRSIQKFNKETGLHPTQKPTELFKYLINTYTNENDIIVDCCAGSGTTALAAKNINRNYIVNDIEYKYVQIIEDRIKNII
jgi:site-specific DNA-methyltransferase (adenine-specific)